MPSAKVLTSPTHNHANLLLECWGCEAVIKKEMTTHTARHTFTALVLTLGADLYVVSKLLGHRDLKTTEIYAKIVNERFREAVDLLRKSRYFSSNKIATKILNFNVFDCIVM